MKAANPRSSKKRAVSVGIGCAFFATVGVQCFAQLDNANLVTITCELASYADGLSGDGWHMIPTNARLGSVSGVVLRVVEPESLAGQVFSFHFDGPPRPEYRWFYEPGLRYRGQIDRCYIGRLAFMCDPGLVCTELQEPLHLQTSQDLSRMVRDRHWNSEYLSAIKKQFGDKMLFRVLYGFLADTNQSSTRLKDQNEAARYLVKFQPTCDVSPTRAIRETLGTWDETISAWPLYLWRSFGHAKVMNAVSELEKGKLGETESEKLQMWRFWLGGDEKDLESSATK